MRMPSILTIYLLKLNRLIYKTKPRIPTCYLLSSKFILLTMISLAIYFLTMDIILIFKVKHRADLSSYLKNQELLLSLAVSPPSSATAASSILTPVLDQQQQTNKPQSYLYKKTNGLGIFWPLPVKKIMMADATHYIRSPLAEFVESNLKFSEIFPFISANIISLTHCILSILCTKFLCDKSLFKRQLGVCLFQFRNFLDSFDGVIYRAHAKKNIYKSQYGTFGYFIDAVSDVFGGICLCSAIFIYLYRNPPPNRNRTKCFRLAEDLESTYRSNDSSSSSYYYSKLNNNNSSSINNNNSCSSNSSSSSINNDNSISNSKNNLVNTSNTSCIVDIDDNNNNNNSLYATKAVIFLSVALCGIRIALSALFWDRSVHAYEDLLDCASKNQLHEHLQINVLKSNITIFIMLSWRFLNALSLQDFILTAIFIDKIWEFIVKTQWIGWVLLLGLIILTELHVSEIRSILLQAQLS